MNRRSTMIPFQQVSRTTTRKRLYITTTTVTLSQEATAAAAAAAPRLQPICRALSAGSDSVAPPVTAASAAHAMARHTRGGDSGGEESGDGGSAGPQQPAAKERFWHFSPRRGDHVEAAIPLRSSEDPASYSEISAVGGASTCGWNILRELQGGHRGQEVKVGLMVAGNSGRPAGGCGLRGAITNIHAFHRTQEEDIVSNWMVAENGAGNQDAHNELYRATIDNRWGMIETHSRRTDTIQGVDYRRTRDPWDYADAWVVRRCRMCTKSAEPAFEPERSYECTLVFVAGPNAGALGQSEGSMARTCNRHCAASAGYPFFRASVKSAMRTGMDAMISEGCSVALLAQLSCGIYAGRYRRRINAELRELVTELLTEPLDLGHQTARAGEGPVAAAQAGDGGNSGLATPGMPRGCYFLEVVVPMLG
jgi:hypothetical protein